MKVDVYFTIDEFTIYRSIVHAGTNTTESPVTGNIDSTVTGKPVRALVPVEKIKRIEADGTVHLLP